MCKVGSILSGLDPDDLELMADLVAERHTYPQLAEVLAAGGWHVHGDTVADHIRGMCRCGPGVPLRGSR